MPPTKVVIYRESDGTIPLLEWISGLNAKAQVKCFHRIRYLSMVGHEARRPQSDYLEDGLHELRARVGRVNYRLLYFHHPSAGAVLVHGVVKEGRIPAGAMKTARERRAKFLADPQAHTCIEERD